MASLKRVLVVEDDPMLRVDAATILEESGLEVVQLETGTRRSLMCSNNSSPSARSSPTCRCRATRTGSISRAIHPSRDDPKIPWIEDMEIVGDLG